MRAVHAVVAALALGLGTACADEAAAPEIFGAAPPYGSLLGGDVITIVGRGFGLPGAGTLDVRVDARRPPLVTVLDDEHLEIITPPAVTPGPVEVAITRDGHVARSTTAFRYSAPPVIDAVSPGALRYDLGGRVVLTGRGFLDEDAGPTTVWLDGAPLVPETVTDTTLAFFAPSGEPLATADLELLNRRGRAMRPDAFRYVTSLDPGLLLFGNSLLFALYVNPRNFNDLVGVPWRSGAVRELLTAVVRDVDGAYWAVDGNRALGAIDLGLQRRERIRPLEGRVSALTRLGDGHLAVDEDRAQLARLDLATGALTPFGDALPCCAPHTVAFDGERLWLTWEDAEGTTVLAAMDPVTGVLATPRLVDGAEDERLQELRWFGARLYAVSDTGRLVIINAADARAVTFSLPAEIGHVYAMEVVDGVDAPAPAP